MRATTVTASIDVMSCVQYGRNDRNGYNRINVSETAFRGVKEAYRASDTTRRRRAAYEMHKRQRAVKLNVMKFVLLGIVMGILLFAMGIVTKASTKGMPTEYKYYNSITVEYKQNMLDIAKEYRDHAHYATDADYVAEVSRINNLSYNGEDYPEIHAGDYLVIPYYSAEIK